jgi:6-phosphogluconolactonase
MSDRGRSISRASFLRGVAGVAGGALLAGTGGPAEAGITAGGYGPEGTLRGHLEASRSGRSVDYSFDYPGGEEVYTVDLQVWPDQGTVLDNAGFRVYGPNGSIHVVGGARRGLRPNVSADVIGRNRGRHVVQVYNANAEIPIDYELRLRRGRPESQTNAPTGQPASGPVFAYVGSYTAPGGGGKGHGEGVYVLRLDPASGMLSRVQAVGEIPQPSYVTVDPLGRFAYAVGEVNMFEGQRTGLVGAYAIDPVSGRLTFLNRQVARDPITNFATVTPTGRNLLITNYSGASVAVLPIRGDGSLGEVSHLIKNEGPPGPLPQQTSPHPHQILFDPTGRWILSPDLGLDRVYVFGIDEDAGRLIPNDPPYFQMHLGAGSRHVTFHPSTRFAYVNGERDTTITAFAWDGERGTLEKLQTLPTVPDDYAGQKWSSHIAVHPSGQTLYVCNRRHNSIAVFSIDQDDGRLTLQGFDPTGGEVTRSFGFDPWGNFLYTANQDTDTIGVHRILGSGRLTQVGAVEIATPTSIVFAQL